MFHRIKSVRPLENHVLLVVFLDGSRKSYDLEPLIRSNEAFAVLGDDENLFKSVQVIDKGYALAWNDSIDLECETMYAEGSPL